MKSERESIQPPMSKTHDYVYEYQGYHTPDATCRIRVYQRPGDVPVVIASELPTNDNTSITNMAEYLAAEIIARHFPNRFEEEKPVAWIEHYPPIQAYNKKGKNLEYSLVEFDSFKPRMTFLFGEARVSIGHPTWRHLKSFQLAELLGENPD